MRLTTVRAVNKCDAGVTFSLGFLFSKRNQTSNYGNLITLS